MSMLPNRPELTDEEKHAIKSLFAEESNSSNATKEIIRGCVFDSDELFNVLTPYKYKNPKNGEWEYLRSVYDIKLGMQLERNGRELVVDHEFSSIEKKVIESLGSYYKKIRDSIREDNDPNTAFIHLSKKDLNMMNKQARELVQNLIDEVING
jgi:hypothetical protein